MSVDKHSRLVQRALQLKKAWLCAVAILGGGTQLSQNDCIIPDYDLCQNHWLKRHITDLEEDLEHILQRMFLEWKPAMLSSTAIYLAKHFEQWESVGFQLYEIGRVQEVEKQVGKLGHSRFMDCPPYAQVILQGLHGAAIRHLEYHLARDLALLYNLFLDSEAILDDALRRKRLHSSEHSQSLGRSVILTCFNLLESFVSGLATARLMQEPPPTPEVFGKLDDKSWSLRKRLIEYPALITGKLGVIDGSKPPVEPLFGECKRRRDSFVHCEPGSKPTKWGYVKENEFHDVEATTVRRTVTLTCDAISLVWKAVYGKEKPSWMPTPADNGRFPNVEVELRVVGTRGESPTGTTKSSRS